jgi:predicted phosphoribosyltransferase
MYEDRKTAGRILCEQLRSRNLSPDVVLAVPPGGVNVAHPIREHFDADLGLIVSEPIRPPSSPDMPVGAVADTGVSWIDETLVSAFGVDSEKLDIEKQRAFRDARNKHEVYDELAGEPTPEGTVAIIEEGIVNEMTTKASLSAINQVDGCRSVAAAPMAVPHAAADVCSHADEVVVDETLSDSRVLEQFYEHFGGAVAPDQLPSE